MIEKTNILTNKNKLYTIPRANATADYRCTFHIKEDNDPSIVQILHYKEAIAEFIFDLNIERGKIDNNTVITRLEYLNG